MKIKNFLHMLLPLLLALVLCFGCAKAEANDVTMVCKFFTEDQIF